MFGQRLIGEVIPKTSLEPLQRAANTYQGTSVSRGSARTALVRLDCGSVPSGSTVDVSIMGRNRTTTNWENVKAEDGTTNIVFAQRTNAAAGDLVGVLPLDEKPYDEYRADATVVGASGAAFSVVFTFGDFAEKPCAGGLTNVWASTLGVGAR